MKFLLTGGYGYGNVGDEAQLAGIIDELKREFSNLKLSVLTPNPKYTNEYHKIENSLTATRVCLFRQKSFPSLYNIRSVRKDSVLKYLGNSFLKLLFWFLICWFITNSYLFKYLGITLLSSSQRKVIQSISDTDCLFVVGGGYLTEQTLSRLLDTSMLIWSAKVLNTPVVMSGQQVGKIHNFMNKWFFKKALKNCQLISTRDPHDSIASLQKLLPNELFQTNVMFTSDDALLIKENNIMHNYNGYIGIQLHYWGVDNNTDLISFYRDFIKQLKLKRDTKLVLFGMHSSDEQAINDLKETLPDIEVFHHDYNFKTVMSFLRSLDCVISMKHHPLIFALGGSVPVISINHSEYYVHKNTGALKNFDLEKYAIMLDKNNLSQLNNLLQDLLSNKIQLKERISTGLQKAEQRRKKFWGKVKKIL